jgi:hypothetical protein
LGWSSTKHRNQSCLARDRAATKLDLIKPTWAEPAQVGFLF